MRYIADSNGYLQAVSFGSEITCGDASCVEYTGGVPDDYASLEAWYIAECEKLYRWKIVSGELTLDSLAIAPTDKTAAEKLADLGGISITKLWENASPTSEFSAQTISLDLSGYSAVIVTACAQTTYQWHVSQFCPVGQTGLLTYGWGDTKLSAHRDFNPTTVGVEFGDAYYSGVLITRHLIPHQIYGIKGVK